MRTYLKKKCKNKVRGVAQVVEHLPVKHAVLSLISTISNLKKRFLVAEIAQPSEKCHGIWQCALCLAWDMKL
jgi:hypothetical protein